MGDLINELNSKNIKLNITAVYSSKQTEMILKNKQNHKGNNIYFCWKSWRCWKGPNT